MEINVSGVRNVTDLSGSVADNDINVIVFVALIGVLILAVPFIIGKNGNIHSRDWFSRHK